MLWRMTLARVYHGFCTALPRLYYGFRMKDKGWKGVVVGLCGFFFDFYEKILDF